MVLRHTFVNDGNAVVDGCDKVKIEDDILYLT